MDAVDHTPPVEGAQRVFKRDTEGKRARADGGHSRRDSGKTAAGPADEGTEDTVGETDEGETEDADDERFRATIKEVDHMPPVEGAKRTFERDREERQNE